MRKSLGHVRGAGNEFGGDAATTFAKLKSRPRGRHPEASTLKGKSSSFGGKPTNLVPT